MNNNMEYKIDEHTIEFQGSGTGSIDPWSSEYARKINVSVMCTADMAEFMLVDGSHIYKFDSFNNAKWLGSCLEEGFVTWEMFTKWLDDEIKTRHVFDDGLLEDSYRNLESLKRHNEVWKSFNEKEKREVYEYVKTLSKEERENWYEEKFKELGI